MSTVKIVAIFLLVAGALGLVYGGFTYTSERHRADIGSLHLAVDEKEHVYIPMWVGVGALITGGALLLGFRGKA